ncbi:MAG: zinc-binding dehydrogenase [Deltaproteobacteria bacterium]|nr:zinc-binding dehydrogenase [Deltaproteobacteria bacterium]
MKAAVFKEENILVVEDVPDPKPGDDEIIMKVSYCAICGSDLHRYAYGMMNPGTIMGHEFSGEVVDLGKNVKGFKVGDRVTRCGGKISPGSELSNFPPRYSARERGFLPLKPGAYAQYMATSAEKVMKIPDEITDLEASLIEPLTVAVHMVRISNIRLGDNTVVLGAGPIGLFAQQCASLAGALRVYVSDINPARLRVALELGAHKVFDPSRVDLVKEIVKLTEIGADVALECAGAKATLQQALELVKMGGRVMVVSLAWEQVDCLPVEWVGREVEMKTCYGHLNSEWLISLSLMQEKKIKTGPMISKIVGLSEIQEAFQELLKPGNELVQVVVQCN